MKWVSLLFLGVYFSTCFQVFSQAGSVDLSFNGDLINYGTGPNEAVVAIAPLPDGKFIFGGFFTEYNGTPKAGIVRVNDDGSIDPTFETGTGLTGNKLNAAYKILIRPDSKLIIAGSFQAYNGTSRNNIALLNSDGSLNFSFNPGTGANGIIRDIGLQDDGKIIIVGRFSEYNGSPANGIARINPDGSFDPTFQIPQILRIPQTVFPATLNKMEIQKDGKIVLAGSFDQINGETLRGLCRLNKDGSLDLTFQPDLGERLIINSMVIQDTGEILVGGRIRYDNQFSKSLLKLIKKDGGLDTSFDAPDWSNASVTALALDHAGKILVGLDIDIFDGVSDDDPGFASFTQAKLERLHQNGTLDTEFNSNVKTAKQGYSTIFKISVGIKGNILLGAQLYDFPNPEVNFFAALNPDGFFDENFNPLPGTNVAIRTMALDSEERILIGGLFTNYRGKAIKGIARLKPDGNLDRDFDPGLGPKGWIASIAIQKDGKILVGGSFTEFNGIPTNRIIRLNQDGSIDNTFDHSAGANGIIYSIITQNDDKILVGGQFSSFNGLPKNYLVRLNKDGSLDNSFNLDPSFTISVRKILIQEDGTILVGGSSFSNTIQKFNGLVRLHPNGSLDKSFNPMGNSNNASVSDIAVQSDGKILVIGSFRINNGSPLYRLARFDQYGSFDNSFIPITRFNAFINTIAVQADDKILVAGNLFDTNGWAKNLLRFDSGGNEDFSFDKGSGPNSGVNSILLQEDGKILIAGNFTHVNNISRVRIARLLNDKDCYVELKAKDKISLALDKDGKARLSPEMLDEGSCSTCGPVKLTLDKCDFTCEDIGKQIVKFSVTDKKGNTQTKPIEVTVVDEMSPTVGIGQQSFVWIMQKGDTFTLPDFRPFIGAEDNCSFEINQTPAPGTRFKKPTNTNICFDVVDNSGNKTTAHIGFSLIVFECLDSGKNSRLSEEAISGTISTPWNTSLEQAISEGVKFEDGSDPEIIKRIVWNSNNYNRFVPGEYSLNATIQNTFIHDMDPSVDLSLIVENKPLAEDISINNNIVPRNVHKNEIIGKLVTVDKIDDIHSYSMDPNSDFYIVKDVLVWKGSGFPDFETNLLIHSHDRAGQTISREIVIQRKLSMINEVLIYPNPTMDQLNLEFKLLEKTNFWLRIFDAQGKLVWEHYFENKTSFIEKFDVHKYSPGMYTIQVHERFLIKSYKFIKK